MATFVTIKTHLIFGLFFLFCNENQILGIFMSMFTCVLLLPKKLLSEMMDFNQLWMNIMPLEAAPPFYGIFN